MPKPVQASTYTFRHLIDGGYVYVDKTKTIYDLVNPGSGIYFLARPRRFGKSLLLSILEEIFQGNKELFKEQWIYNSDYRWQKHPIIHIDFSLHRIQNPQDLETRLKRIFYLIAQENGVELVDGPFDIQFEDLIRKMAREKDVVILIDEYDKPILDNIEHLATAQAIRDTLRSFYTILKAMDRYIRFIFITGISKFSKVGVFSTMNNLTDLTMHPGYATLLGITEEELAHYFADHIAGFAARTQQTVEDLQQQIRTWYDGFCFVEDCSKVYNPFSTLQLLVQQRFANYWFETGTPTFLIKLLKEQQYDVALLDDLRAREVGFSTYEIESLSIVPLLFQTGYLTIKAFEPQRRIYTLAYPNQEVEEAFVTYLLGEFNERERSLNEAYLWRMIDALEAQNLDAFFELLQTFFANVPYNIHLKHEKYYQSLFYLIFKLIGLRIDAEVHTNQGRIDAVIETVDRIFLFEFKLDKSATEALQQIRTQEYFRKYQGRGKPMTLIGANFDSAQRKVSEWLTEAEV
ncbi:MAG: AAA family ATPase [Caldilineaceae bacterium]